MSRKKIKQTTQPKGLNQLEVDKLQGEFAQALALHQKGDLSGAKSRYEAILNSHPRHFDALHLSGVIALQSGNAALAVQLITQAIEIDPKIANAHYNLGNAYRKLRKNKEAIRSYDRAIAIKANFADAHHNQGSTFFENKQHRLAVQSFDRAAAIDPNDAHVYYNRGNALKNMGDYLGALQSYRKALELKPDYDFLLGRILLLKLQIADWSGLEKATQELMEKVEQGKRVTTPFAMLTLSDSPRLQQKAAKIWVDAVCPPNNALPPIGKYKGHQKIRLGYFSADFREHAVSYLTAELFEKHDRSKFEVYGFSFGPKTDDPMQRRLKKGFDQFIDVSDKTDLEIALLAREMQIDIAIDLGGFTQDSRTGIFALRAAPVQVSYLGYLGTMSAPYIDYLIADEVLIPPEARQFYSEKIIYLPTYQVNDSQRKASDKIFTRAELGLPEKGFVFGCLNNNYKINPLIFESWMRILNKVRGSVLFLYVDNELAKVNLRREASARGMDSERIIFAKRRPREEYLAQYRQIDLFLDTYPYNAGVTASDALWMSRLLLSMSGVSISSRMGKSFLSSLGLGELATASASSYEEMAIRCGQNHHFYEVLLEKLAQHKLASIFNFKECLLGVERSLTLACKHVN